MLKGLNVNDERYLITQHERDGSTGLDYRGARYYDSDIGRFLSLDPLETKFPAWSAYNYVFCNPILLVDPNGKEPQDPGEKFKRKYHRWYKKHGEELIKMGLDHHDRLMKFESEKGSKRWCQRYRNEVENSEKTGWTKGNKYPKNVEFFSGGMDKGSTDDLHDIGTNKASIIVRCNIYPIDW